MKEAMKVGIAIPCHENDWKLMKYCLHSILNLKPLPFLVEIGFNRGQNLNDLKQIVTTLFDKLFSEGCDVVLKCDADFYLFPHILRYVKKDKLVTFTKLNKRRGILPLTIHSLLLRKRAWTGCFSIPKKLWFGLAKEHFDGTDTSISERIKERNIKMMQYYDLRPYREDATKQLLTSFSVPKRILWQLLRLKAVRLN